MKRLLFLLFLSRLIKGLLRVGIVVAMVFFMIWVFTKLFGGSGPDTSKGVSRYELHHAQNNTYILLDTRTGKLWQAGGDVQSATVISDRALADTSENGRFSLSDGKNNSYLLLDKLTGAVQQCQAARGCAEIVSARIAN